MKTENRFEVGNRVKIYDRYRFALPVYGHLQKRGSTDSGWLVVLEHGSHGRADEKNPEGIWVFEAQLRRLKPKPQAEVKKAREWKATFIHSAMWQLEGDTIRERSLMVREVLPNSITLTRQQLAEKWDEFVFHSNFKRLASSDDSGVFKDFCKALGFEDSK